MSLEIVEPIIIPTHGITPEAIDAILKITDGVDTGYLRAQETPHLAESLLGVMDGLYKVITRRAEFTDAGPIAADNTVRGFLIAHQLVRHSLPDYQPPTETLAQLKGKYGYARLMPFQGTDMQHYPHLAKQFDADPDSYQYLLETIDNRAISHGAQVLLLCVSEPNRFVEAVVA